MATQTSTPEGSEGSEGTRAISSQAPLLKALDGLTTTQGKGDSRNICQKCQQPRRTVYRLAPLTSFPAREPLKTPQQAPGNQKGPFLTASTRAIPAASATAARAILGPSRSKPVPCTSLAVGSQTHASTPMATCRSFRAEQSSASPAPEGSWTRRQLRFPDGDCKAKYAPTMTRPAVKANKGRESAEDALNAEEALSSEQAVKERLWRMRFKKKWIREELYAYKQDFPDDPEYKDTWGEALEFIEACGCQAVLQAAFLEGKSLDGRASPVRDTSEDDLLDEDTLFEESKCPFHGQDSSCPACDASSLSARAATLLRLQRQATAAAAA